jgi:hypothetical protein
VVNPNDQQAQVRELPPLDPEDRAWLDRQLRRYKALLTYLQEH